MHSGEGFQNGFRTASARRVDDDDIGMNVFVIEARHELCGVADEEHRIFYAIVTRIFLRIIDRGLDDLDAINTMRLLCEEERDRTCAAVGVDDSVHSIEICIFESLLIKNGGLLRIDLEK